jgi:O-antigen ligase
MIMLGLIYFSVGILSGQDYFPINDRDFFIYVIKYFIIIITGYELLKRVTITELFVFLIIGALSTILELLFFYDPTNDNGRYSGFYLNANSMGFICMIGYGLCFGIGQKKLRLIGQVIFTLIGLLTFSRTFIVVWLLMNLISLRLSIKNIRIFLIGFGLFVGLLTYNEFLPVKNKRLEQMGAIISGNSIKSSGLDEDSRTETWSFFYEAITEHPFFGNGMGAFSTNGIMGHIGVHNTYLKIIGEAGIFTLLIFLAMYALMAMRSITQFMKMPHLLLMTLAYCLYIATNHNYFDAYYLLFISMWIQYQIEAETEKNKQGILELT